MSSTHEMNPDELERLLLDENSTDEQLASMKAALEQLAKKVDSLASKEVPQVCDSTDIIARRLASLRECPAQMSQGVSTRTAKQLEDLVSSRINEECDLIELELQRLKGLEQEAFACKKVVCEMLTLILRAKALQSDTVKQRTKQHRNVLVSKVKNEDVCERVPSQSIHSDGLHFQSAEAGGSGNAPEIAYEQLNVSDFDHVEYHLNFDPVAAAQGKLHQNGKVLKQKIAEPRLLQPGKTTDFMPRTRGSSQSSSTSLQSPGGSPRSESQMGHIFASIALPEVEVYKDSEGRNFEDFIMRFSMKYQNLGLQNRLLNHLLLSKLDGYPKAVAKALPKHIREGNFDDLINALRSKFELNSSSIQMKAYMDLKRLRKSGDVTRYCLELERLTREAYPGASEEELSRTRAGELVSQLTDWPEYLQLYTTMEIAPKEAAYEMVKAMAQRCERSKEVAIAMREASTGYTRHLEGQRRRGNKSSKTMNVQNSVAPPEVATGSKETQVREEQRKTLAKCYNCGKQGHLKRDCTLSKKSNAMDKERAGQQTGSARIFTASLKKWICGAVEAGNKCELVGEQTTTEVRLLGMSRKALLDTGSQISIIPLQMLQTAWESGFDLDADVEEIPLEQQKQVFDASGNKMSFKGAIRLTLQIDSGRKERIALFVMSGGDGMIVLGTNALQKLGYGLTHQNQKIPTKSSTVVKMARTMSERTKKRQTKSPNACLPVTIAKRVYLRPGETKSLRIRCDGLAQEGIFWSKEHLLPDVVWKGGSQATTLPITNTFAGAKIFRVGEEVGTFEPTEIVEVEPVKYSGDMLQRTVEVTAGREEELLRLLQSNRTSEECNEAVEDLVKRYAHAFAVSEQELTQTMLVEHSIETGDATPIRQKARPVPLGTRVELRRILNDLQERKIIEPSKSSWASPIVLVQKKDGTLRLCVDYRKLNQVTKVDSYPLPTIDTILQSLRGKRYFSTLDLSSGYWQVSLSADAKEKSAFTTTEGLYQFRVLPFGLASSPAVFQRLMHAVLGPLLGEEVFCYLDDIMVATGTVEQHLRVLERVFQEMSKARLKLNPKKCILLERKVEFLGHVIDESGLRMDPAKVEAIMKYPLPQSRSDLRTFLGLCSYYRKFVLGFSKVAGPLHDMTSAKVPFEWDSTKESCFEKLKSIIVQAPVLAQPDIEGARSGRKPFKIHTDASVQGLGAVLSQQGDDGFLHPVFFASKGLSRCEKNYHVTDLEALAVVFALRKFHMFVYGLPVEVYTDHQALTALFKRTNVSARVLRWALELQKYNLKIIYLKGAANRVADALSRGAALLGEEEKAEHIPNELIVVSVAEEPEWTKELRKDSVYAEVIVNLEKGNLDKGVSIPGLAQKFKVADFIMDKGYLALLENCSVRRVVPPSKRRAIFEEAHSGSLAGHFGPKKLFMQLSKDLFWETMKRDIAQWSQECRECLSHNHRHPMTPGLKPIVTTKPYELVGIDILEMGLTTDGNRYILSVIDHFSKFGGAYAIPSKTAAIVARTLFERWIAEGGRHPKCILSDQGGEFDNRLMQELRSMMGIGHIFTKGYNPRENGLTERFNQTLIQMLRKKVTVPTDWDKILPFCVFAYNTTVHDSTGESPFYLLHGFDPYVPWSTVPNREPSTYVVDLESYAQEVAVATKMARDYAREKNDKMRQKMKIAYDRDKGVCTKTPKVGDRVYLKAPREKQSSHNPKLVNPWEGPYRVIDVSENSALITLIEGDRDAVRVPFDMLVKLPPGVTNEPLRTVTTRRKRGRPKKGTDAITVSEKIICFRTLITVDHPLNLRRKCECGLFDQMAHVAIPTLKHPMARSKRVSDMFQLANVASISEEECWGDERKEEELRMKNSQFLSPYGLALAMQAHRRRCHSYSEAIEAAQGMRFEHPALFPWAVKYDAGAHITTALAMLKHISVPGASTVATQRVFLGLPSSFGRVHTEVDYDSEMIVYVYQEWELLAQKLLEIDVVTAIILVWPDAMPSGRSMRQVLIALERHLQPGGTLLFFPSPYEDSNATEWANMGRVCSEFVRFMTAADRGFEAIVRDHYTEVLESAPYTHPAICLGTDPRYKRSPFNGRQILLFLEKLRVTIADILRLPEFKVASTELKEARREEKAARVKRRRDEFKPNFFVIADPGRDRHHLNMSFREPATRGPDGRVAREPSEEWKRRRTSAQQYRGQPHGRTPTSTRQFGKDRTQLPSSSSQGHR